MDAAICHVQAKGAPQQYCCQGLSGQTLAADGSFLCMQTSKLQYATAATCAGTTATNRMWVNVFSWGQLATYQRGAHAGRSQAVVQKPHHYDVLIIHVRMTSHVYS